MKFIKISNSFAISIKKKTIFEHHYLFSDIFLFHSNFFPILNLLRVGFVFKTDSIN
jgi:hypothetical protein